MNFDGLVDLGGPVVALLVARSRQDALKAAWERVQTRAGGAAMRIEGFMARDLLGYARSARLTQVALEALLIAVAFVVLFTGLPGYCGTFRFSGWAFLSLIPSLLVFSWTVAQAVQDAGTRPVPSRLMDGLVIREDVAGHPDLLASFDRSVGPNGTQRQVQFENPDEVRALQQIIERVAGRGASPAPYLTSLILGPVITTLSLLAFATFVGWYGLFSLNGPMHASMAAIGLLSILAAMLAGAGYKLVVGVARALGLAVTDGIAQFATVMVRLLATALPGITSEDADKKVPAITGETFKNLMTLTEKVENLPIASFFLLVVMASLFPHPLVLVAMLAVGAIAKARFGHLQANEDPDANKTRLAEVKRLDTKLQWATTLVVVLVIGASLFRGVLADVALVLVEVINFFMRLGVPSSVTPDNWDWAGAIAVGILVMLIAVAFGFGALAAKSLGKGSKAVIALLATAVVLVIAGNWQRRAAYVIRPEWVAAQVSCPVGPGDVAPAAEASSPLIPPLPATPSAPVAPAPPVAPSAAPSVPVVAAPRRSRSRATGGGSSRFTGTLSGWTAAECAAVPAGTPGCP